MNARVDPDDGALDAARTRAQQAVRDLRRRVRRLDDDGLDLILREARSHYAWRDEPDQAFEWLNRALQERDSNLPAMVWEPIFADLRTDPRWGELMAEMGLKER